MALLGVGNAFISLTIVVCVLLVNLTCGLAIDKRAAIDPALNGNPDNVNVNPPKPGVEAGNMPAGGAGNPPLDNMPGNPNVNAGFPNKLDANPNLNAGNLPPKDNFIGAPAGGGNKAYAAVPPAPMVGGNNGNNPKINPKTKMAPVKIAENPDCAADVKSFCSQSSMSNNFAILDCLQNDLHSEQQINPKCQHFLWGYKRNLTSDIRLDSAAGEVCGSVLKKFPECDRLELGKGLVIPCLIDLRPNITDPNCKQFLVKMSSIVFSDYRLIQKMADACNADIGKLHCGRIHSTRESEESPPHTQGHTIECLSQNVKQLDEQCKHEILRIAELQADNYHMDRPLFYACREDRERFCKRTKAGSGKIFKCLFRHKFEKDMSHRCQEKLVNRQRLMQEDFKVNKGLAENCQRDIQAHKCLKGDLPDFKHGRLSVILLCLEGAMKDGKDVDPECLGELKDIRQSLMEDFKISPNIVVECASEIENSCGQGLHRKGRTLHCLMDLARVRRGKGKGDTAEIGDRCRRELESLIMEADVGENYEMDAALQEACMPVAQVACHDVKAGESRVLTCLMEKVGTKAMTDDCEERLMEIQYFISRDFKLDSRLYKYCRKDAATFCSATDKWHNTQETTPEHGPLVFSCLYRHLKFYQGSKDKQLSRTCMFEVKRAMHQRAISVDLEPRIEGPCMSDLGAFCSVATERGDKIACLQDHYDELTVECRVAVGNFTEDEDEDLSLDRILMTACTPMIKQFCKQFCNDLLDNQDTKPGDVMECLIRFKHHNNMDDKCAAGIEHHQLISLKDYRFTLKFKEACRKDVMQHCKGSKKKADVIRCLSETVRTDTLLDVAHRVGKFCRKQLRFEMLQRDESIDLDPRLKDACREDVAKLCENTIPGSSQVIECLKKHAKKLSPNCHKKIFQRERETAENPNTDYLLMTSCKRMIKQYCLDEALPNMFRCLKQSQEEPNFDPKCRKTLLERMRQRSHDVRLNPQLQRSCDRDIPKFCSEDLKDMKQSETEVEGKVITCLRIRFSQHKLLRSCTEHIAEVIKASQLDYQQDPVLMEACKNEISDHCWSDDEKGQVQECLKQRLAKQEIASDACKIQIARVLAEDNADVHVDPLLYKACALDLKHYCYDVPRGEGKQMSCLLAALDDKTVHLRKECQKGLQDRVTMWEYAAKVAPPETIQELVDQVVSSRPRNYFLAILIYGSLVSVSLGLVYALQVAIRDRSPLNFRGSRGCRKIQLEFVDGDIQPAMVRRTAESPVPIC